MTTTAASSVSTSDRDELGRVRGEHGNIARLLLVLESHFAGIHAGDELDAKLLRDAVTYLLEYVDRFHREREDLFVADLAAHRPAVRVFLASLTAQHVTVRTSGAELDAHLERIIDGGLVERAQLVHHGFAYCTALRRSMALEEGILGLSSTMPAASALEAESEPAIARTNEDRYRGRFEELTHRIGCDCSYVRSS